MNRDKVVDFHFGDYYSCVHICIKGGKGVEKLKEPVC